MLSATSKLDLLVFQLPEIKFPSQEASFIICLSYNQLYKFPFFCQFCGSIYQTTLHRIAVFVGIFASKGKFVDKYFTKEFN